MLLPSSCEGNNKSVIGHLKLGANEILQKRKEKQPKIEHNKIETGPLALFITNKSECIYLYVIQALITILFFLDTIVNKSDDLI